MLAADTFFSSQAMLAVVVALVGLAAFAMGWLLLGTAARVKADREMAARMAAIGRPVPQSTASAVDRPGTGWIPESVSSFGERFATSQGFGEKLDAQLEAAGISLRSGEFVVATVGAGLLAAVLAAAMLQNVLLAAVIGVVGALVPTIVLRTALSRRADKMREQLPDVLTIMASSLRAGHSFLQALDTTAREISAPANVEFQRLVAEIRLGRPAEDALEALADRVGSPDFRWAVLAVNIQREVGGNLAEILDNVSDTLRERAMMRRQIRVLTAEGRLSAWVLGFMPFVFGL
jgi:tight adherence protein B